MLNPVLPVHAGTVQITVLLAIRFFFSTTPRYVPKMFLNLLLHNKAGTCLCSQTTAGGRKQNFLTFALYPQTRLKLQPPKKNSSVSTLSVTQEPADTAAAHPHSWEHIYIQNSDKSKHLPAKINRLSERKFILSPVKGESESVCNPDSREFTANQSSPLLPSHSCFAWFLRSFCLLEAIAALGFVN